MFADEAKEPEDFFYGSRGDGYFVFHVVTPGARILHPDADQARCLDDLLRGAMRAFFNANGALNQYIRVRDTPLSSVTDWIPHPDDEREIANLMDNLYPKFTKGDPNDSPETQRAKSLEITKRFHADGEFLRKKAAWRRGKQLGSISNDAIMYARTFLLSLDMVFKCLRKLTSYTDAPVAAKNAVDKLYITLPDISEARNSVSHLEDRIVGERKHGKAIPIVQTPYHAGPGRTVILEGMNGDNYEITKADGHIGRVHVGPETIILVRAIMIELFAAYDWIGPIKLYPEY